MSKLRGGMDGITKWTTVHDGLKTTEVTAPLVSAGGGIYRGQAICGPMAVGGNTPQVPGGGVIIDSGTFVGVPHDHVAHASSTFLSSIGQVLTSANVDPTKVDLGTNVRFSMPLSAGAFVTGWQAAIQQDGSQPVTGRVFVLCTRLG